MSVAIDQSQTRLNLMRAFAGESQARNRYTFAAGLARRKNLYVLESVFTFTAGQEQALSVLRQAEERWQETAGGQPSSDEAAQAAGELLLAAADSIRLAGVDAEEALTFASKAFCRAVEGGQEAERSEQ